MSVAPERRGWVTLGQMLVQDGILTDEQVSAALERQRKSKDRLGQILIEMRLIDEEVLLKYLGAQFRKEPITRQDLAALDLEVVKLIPEEVARQHRVIAAERNGRRLIVATADPLNVVAIDDLRRATGLDIDFRIGPGSAIQEAIERTYRRMISTEGIDEALRQDLGLSVGLATAAEEAVDIKQLRTQADDPPVVKVVNYVLGRAASDTASDIHVEPHEDRTRVRYRVDGLLFDLLEIPRSLHLAVVSRLKIISRLDIAERRLPQDGRIRLRVHGKDIDLRISTVPTMHGESVVMRILDKGGVALDFQRLGFEPDILERFLAVLMQPHGILLVTGPTGSGKTTTLYTALERLNQPDVKILTVEDPVEYQMPGINQIQVKPQINLTFANALRSIVRQDPDVIMIGEIRDLETAEIAVQSALTGHLVLSTVHTNDAASTMNRMLDMGVEDYLLTSTIVGVLAQRLVRTLCPHCKEAHAALPEIVEQMRLDRFTDDKEITLYRPIGCPQCAQTGYTGRISIMEMLPMSDPMRSLVMKHATASDLRNEAIGEGMLTMYEDGLRKAVRGITTFEEVLRVTREG